MEIALSIHSVQIRLTSERWLHIVENHDDLAGRFYDALEVVAEPNYVLEGKSGEFLAVKKDRPFSFIVVYRELSRDGFVITAFQTTKSHQLLKTRKIVWRKQNQ